MADVLAADPKGGDRLAPGVHLGRYELLLPVARGGMARVWAARQHGQRGFNKLVAVKTILPHLRREAQFERMFVNEARVASFIQHPNCCQTIELGEDGDILYMAMEWITGDSLARALKVSGKAVPMDPRIIARVVADACAGLHAAHQQTDEIGNPLHIVHRDVSPHNIMTGADGTVKVCDFGVAKALGSLQEATLAGQIKGKLNYMSPEQFMGAPLDARADVFAIGVVIYEATTGRQPFEGENDLMVMQNLARGVFNPPSALVRNYPRELEQIVVRAMQSERERRFDTAEQLRMALEEWLARSGPIVTQSHVAAAVRERIGNIIDARRDQIAKASQGGRNEGTAWPELPGHTPSNLAAGAGGAQMGGPVGAPGTQGAPTGGNSKSGVRSANPLHTTVPLQPSSVHHAMQMATAHAAARGQGGTGNTVPPSSGGGQWWDASAQGIPPQTIPPQQHGLPQHGMSQQGMSQHGMSQQGLPQQGLPQQNMSGPYSGVGTPSALMSPGNLTGSGPMSPGFPLGLTPGSGPHSMGPGSLNPAHAGQASNAPNDGKAGGAGYYTLAITIGLVLAFIIGGGAWVAYRYTRPVPTTEPTSVGVGTMPNGPGSSAPGTTPSSVTPGTAPATPPTAGAPSAGGTPGTSETAPPIVLPPTTATGTATAAPAGGTDTPPSGGVVPSGTSTGNGGTGSGGTASGGTASGGTGSQGTASGGAGTNAGTASGAPSSTATARPKPKPTALPDNPY